MEDEECIKSIIKDLGPEYCQTGNNTENMQANKELLVVLCKIIKLIYTLRRKIDGNDLDYIYILLVGHIDLSLVDESTLRNVPFPDANNFIHGMPRNLYEYIEIMRILAAPPTSTPPIELTKYSAFIKDYQPWTFMLYEFLNNNAEHVLQELFGMNQLPPITTIKSYGDFALDPRYIRLVSDGANPNYKSIYNNLASLTGGKNTLKRKYNVRI